MKSVYDNSMKKALIIFAKAPVPGTVKTRLQADLGAEKTVEAYKSFVTGLTSQCARLKGVDRFLGCAPSKDHPFLKEAAARNGMHMFNQKGNTLGERIFNALTYCSKKGYSQIVLIGTDSPSMPMEFIKKAFASLEKNDLVIGPCFDQGLYLIGAVKEKVTKLARAVKIDTGKDVSMILKDVPEKGFRLAMLPFWYDIDTIKEYEFLKLHLTYLDKKLPS